MGQIANQMVIDAVLKLIEKRRSKKNAVKQNKDNSEINNADK